MIDDKEILSRFAMILIYADSILKLVNFFNFFETLKVSTIIVANDFQKHDTIHGVQLPCELL